MAEQEILPAVQSGVFTYFDVQIGDQEAAPRRIIFKLYPHVAPKTVENFRSLCTGERGVGRMSNKPLHYRECVFHRVIKRFMAQAGDFENGDGTGGESIYGGKFRDELAGLNLSHNRRGLLSMANSGPDSNGSQFFITFAPAPHLDGKHVIFGEVQKEYMQLLSDIEAVQTLSKDQPVKPVIVTNCGELEYVKIKASTRKRKLPDSDNSSDSDSDSSSSSSSSSADAKKKKKKKKKKKQKDKKDKKKKKKRKK
eukprot:GEMP01056612.1.p1 GENE.GEMP01056612.1~~GEMP01056612.1.p1  ORF type:complete len:253 (+),score=62.35 GEMP01056612.1:105-863(+)